MSTEQVIPTVEFGTCRRDEILSICLEKVGCVQSQNSPAEGLPRYRRKTSSAAASPSTRDDPNSTFVDEFLKED